MNSLPRISVEDTYTLMQLTREAALSRGRTAQAERLAPVMAEMKSIVKAKAAGPAQVAGQPPASAGLLGQADFRALLEVTQAAGNTASGFDSGSASFQQAAERNRMVQAMVLAGMTELDVARQLGMAREEVRLVLSASGQHKTSSVQEVK